MEEKKRTPLGVVKSLTEERDKEILEKISQFVKLAEEGHFSDLVIIGKVRGAPIVEIDWDSDNPVELIGALEMAKMEVHADLREEESIEEED